MRILLAALLFTAACAEGTPTESTCPPTDPPTYDNFAKPFFATYCTSCHSASSRDRNGAPSSENYDTEADVRRHASSIDLHAAAGPAAMNESMPELGGGVTHAPTDAERMRLGEYLACAQQ